MASGTKRLTRPRRWSSGRQARTALPRAEVCGGRISPTLATAVSAWAELWRAVSTISRPTSTPKVALSPVLTPDFIDDALCRLPLRQLIERPHGDAEKT